ncbi:MAG: Calx-beta domain-containing protein [Verrucomicrobiales bacterium]
MVKGLVAQAVENLTREHERGGPLPRGGGPDGERDEDLPGSAYSPAICFAPGTSASLMEMVSRTSTANYPPEFRRESLGGYYEPLAFRSEVRWSRTATDGFISSPTQGKPTTLTWSIVPDGTPISPALGTESSDPSNLRAFLTGIYGSFAVWQAIFAEEFERWSAVTGITYVYEPNDDARTINGSAFSNAGTLGVRGDVRIGGHSIDGSAGPGQSTVLAYNYFPDSGDMVIDTGDSFFNNTSSDSIRLRNTISHEHGHGLGLDHVCPPNQTKLMEPTLSISYQGPQHDDILTAQRQYGDPYEQNDSAGTATDLGVLPAGTTTVDGVGVDDNNDPDYYEFTAPGADYNVAITLRPIGFTYLEAAQNANGSCPPGSNFNSLIIANLSVQLLGTNGSTVLANASGNGAGVNEVIAEMPLPSGAGPYFVRVQGDGTDSNQLYALDITLIDSTPVPAISIADASAGEGAGTITFNVTLDTTSSDTVTVQYSTGNGTATAGSDYAAASGTVTFVPGDTAEQIAITINEDALDEEDETFTVALASPNNATIADGAATGTITDNDPAPTISVASVTVGRDPAPAR